MAYFDNIVYTLERWGVADVLLPFLLIFAVTFAVLEMSKIFGKGRKNINVVVSLVMALAVVFPHVTRTYPHDRDVVVIINSALPGISLLLVAILSFLIVMGLWTGGRFRLRSGNPWTGFFNLVMLIAVIVIFLDAANIWNSPRWLWFLRDPGTQAAILIIAFFGFIIKFITGGGERRPGQTTGNGLKNFLKTFGQMNDDWRDEGRDEPDD